MTSHHHFLSFMEKDSWVLKIERIEKLFDQILSYRGTRRVVKLVEVKELLHSLIPDMDVWYAERANVVIDYRKKVAEQVSEIRILEANLKDAVCAYKAYQALFRKELPPMEDPDFSFLDDLTISQEEDVAGTKQ